MVISITPHDLRVHILKDGLFTNLLKHPVSRNDKMSHGDVLIIPKEGTVAFDNIKVDPLPAEKSLSKKP
jgi:hypothetical protein